MKVEGKSDSKMRILQRIWSWMMMASSQHLRAAMLVLLASPFALTAPKNFVPTSVRAPVVSKVAPLEGGSIRGPPVPASKGLKGLWSPTSIVKASDGKVVPTTNEWSAPKFAASAPVTEQEVLAAQKAWADSIASISKVYKDKGDYVAAAAEAAGKLYGYGKCDVMFKPTRATKHPFRPTAADAMSYFVGAEAMGADDFVGEDGGFAINGGRGWSNVVFRNHKIDLNGPTAQAMGDYVFTDATSGDKVRVEYTFGYKRNDDGKVRIYLHHSSVPFGK